MFGVVVECEETGTQSGMRRGGKQAIHLHRFTEKRLLQ